MNKFLLSTFLATTIIFSNVVRAEETDIATVSQEEVLKMENNHPKFDKNFHEKMAKKMAEKLNLTKEQQEQATQIRQAGRKKIEPLMKEMKALRKKIDTERRANMEEFEKILSPEQKKIFDEMKNKAPKFEKKHMFGKHHRKGRPHPHMEKDAPNK